MNGEHNGSDLPRIRLTRNWKVRDLKTPQFLLTGIGVHLEEIVGAFVADLRAQNIVGLNLGHVWESVQYPGALRTIRVLLTDRKVHHTATDVTFRRQGADLYVKFDVASRTALTWLRYLFYSSIFLTLWSVAYGIYYVSTDAYQALVTDYARKHNSNFVTNVQAYMGGYGIDAETQEIVKTAPLSLGEIFRRDPKLFITGMGGPPSIIAAVIGGLLYLIPQSLIYLPCRLLNWPTPEEFNSLAAGHCAWVEGILSYTLLNRFGIHEAHKTPIS